MPTAVHASYLSMLCCRVHALYFKDNVQSELLSEDQFPDQLTAQMVPHSIRQPAETMARLKRLCHNLCEQMAPYAED